MSCLEKNLVTCHNMHASSASMAENQVHMIKQMRLCLLKFLTFLLQLPGSPVLMGAGWWHVEGSVQLMAL